MGELAPEGSKTGDGTETPSSAVPTVQARAASGSPASTATPMSAAGSASGSASSSASSTAGGGTLRHDGEQPVRALIVDDEDVLRTTLARVLKQRGIVATTAESGFAALDLLEKQPFDVVLVDVRMPGMTGPQFLQRVKAAGYPVEVLMMTAFADIATTVSAVKAGAHGFLTKPFVSNESVVIEVLNAAQFRRLRERTEHLQRELDARPRGGEMVGSSALMREVYRRIDGVATTNSTILILGESGTGKELVARAVHDRSRRAGKAMVTVNCAAIPKELVESELFGHTRGAFTTAERARAGLFEAANGGTLFLDEIGDLPMSAQVKLLRVLQSGEVKPVGSDTSKIVDVRVVAATNVDLKAAIAKGTFRQDLFYRLNVIAVRLPALRERGDDILLLAHHFVQKHAQLANRPATRLSHEAAVLLSAYDWPGNVRELEHAIEHAVVLTQGDVIYPASLPAELLSRQDGASQQQHGASSSFGPAGFGPAPVSHGPSSFGGGPVSGPDSRVASGTVAVSAVSAVTEGAGAGSMNDLVASLGLAALAYPEAKKRILAEFNDAYVGALLKMTSGNMSEAARRSGLDRSNFRRLVRTTAGDVPPSRTPGDDDTG
ncbi:MAG: Response regulator of zinc sigma-54-dependent two-component system [Labilithrix sp.]|nr:Response regulator of zinc sigma-54-dependent two-component system [Labilithrix sp.]